MAFFSCPNITLCSELVYKVVMTKVVSHNIRTVTEIKDYDNVGTNLSVS